MSDPAAYSLQGSSIQSVVRRRLMVLLGCLACYFLVTTLFLLLGNYATILARLAVFMLLGLGVLVALPRARQRGPQEAFDLELPGIWPETWTPRKSIRQLIFGVLIAGGFVSWVTIEAVLMATERFATLASMLLSVDFTILAVAMLLAIWLWWEPVLRTESRLLVSARGLEIDDFPDSSVPGFIGWNDLKRAEVIAQFRRRPTLHLWHRPTRRVISILLSPTSAETELEQLETILDRYVDAPPPPGATPPKRQFHSLLERLGKRHAEEENGGLLAPERQRQARSLSDEEFADLIIDETQAVDTKDPLPPSAAPNAASNANAAPNANADANADANVSQTPQSPPAAAKFTFEDDPRP